MRRVLDIFARSLTAALFVALVPLAAMANEKGRAFGYCDGNEVRKGWHFYCDPDALPPQDEPEEEIATPAPPPAAPKAPKLTPSERLEAFQKRLEDIKALAILEPTEDNLKHYMVAQSVAMRMASTFADQWQRVLYKTPELDANIGNPVSGIGGQVFQDIRTAEREEALVTAALRKGFLFVFQDEATCAVCPVQSRIIGDLQSRFGIRVLAVSLDGSTTPEFPAPLSDNGQIARLGLDAYPRPTLALVDPQTDEVTIIGSGLLTQDVVLERVNVLTRYAPGERYTNEDFRTRYGGAPLSRGQEAGIPSEDGRTLEAGPPVAPDQQIIPVEIEEASR